MRFCLLRYKNITGKELCKILEEQGWMLSRINGSHHIYAKEGENSKLTVPVHSNKALKRGTLNTILKAARLYFIFGFIFKLF